MMIMHIYFKIYLKWQIRKLYIKKNFKCLAKEIYKFLNDLCPPIINIILNIFEVRVNIYNLRNFQSLYCTCKKNSVIWNWKDYVRSPQIGNLVLDGIKNVSSLENFKREIKNWRAEMCLSRICKTYLQNIGFI